MKKLTILALFIFLVPIISATAPVDDPEIRIRQGSTDIASGGSYDFGDQGINTGSTITFKVFNDGASINLNLTGAPLVSIAGTDAAMFTVTQDPVSPVTPGTKTTFKVKFKPTSYGAKTATASISNDDADENPYTIILNGNGINTAPKIKNTVAGQTITDKETIKPFGNVSYNEPNGDNIATTITLDNSSKGSFTAASLASSGFTDAGGGVYTLPSATAANARKAIRKLVFTPVENRVPAGSQETTTFTIQVTDDGTPPIPVSDNTTTVIVTSVNDPVTLGKIDNQSCMENGETDKYALAINDPDAGGVRVSGWSWDETLLLNSGIKFHGSGKNTKIKLIPNPNMSGETKVSIRVTDGSGEDIKTFTLTVHPGAPVNQPPVFIADLPEITLNQAARFKQPLAEWLEKVDDPDTPDDLLTFEVLENGRVSHTMEPDSCVFTAPGDWTGTDTLNVVVMDDGGKTDTTALLVHVVNPVSQLRKNIKSAKNDESTKVVEFSLAQNYPNPFNPSTTIEFGLPEKTHVTLTIYNMLGHEVARLVDEERSAGSYSASWDASTSGAGVYFYKIRAGDHHMIRKCVFSK